jgi:hypothetical protein
MPAAHPESTTASATTLTALHACVVTRVSVYEPDNSRTT